jgi:4-amino-4-deoxy-L-arabinose transferase-like glycosyltransferase
LVVIAVLGFREALRTGPHLMGWDSADYARMAENLLAGQGFVYDGVADIRGEDVEFRIRGHRPPLYPMLIAALFGLSDSNPASIYILQAILLIATASMLYGAARYCLGSGLPALLVLALYAFYLPMLQTVNQVGTELIFAFLLMAHVLFLVRWRRDAQWRTLVIAAVLLGLTILTRPTTFLLPLFYLPLFLIQGSRPWKARWTAFAVHALVAFALLSPWMVRQANMFGTFVPVTTGGGITLWEGTGPAGGWTIPGWARPEVPDGTVREFRDLLDASERGYTAEVELDRLARRKALEIIRADPLHYARVTMVKAPKFWLGLDFETLRPLGRTNLRTLLGLAMKIGMLVLAVVGAFRVVRRREFAFAVPGLVVLYVNLVHLFPYVLHRYSLPIHPLVMLFSGAGMLAIFERFGYGDEETPPVPAQETEVVNLPNVESRELVKGKT